VATNDEALAEKARLLRNHGMQPKYYHHVVGGNFRIDAVQAALLSVKLPHLAEYTAGRQRNACAYQRALGGLPGIVTPSTHPDRNHIVNQYTVRVLDGRRDALRKHLEERGIASEIYYPVPLHQQECFREFGPYPALPVAEALAREAVSLPVFPEMTADEQQAVIDAVTEFAGRRNG
jgi:dTDP-4-amino-4,6-dideoxygalactose transaminase